MARGTGLRRRTAIALALVGTVFIAACGSQPSSEGGTSTSAGGVSTSAGAGTSSASQNTAGVEQARAAIAPYIGKATPFPVTDKLAKIPTGATIAYVDAGTPFTALVFDLAKPAAEKMGVKLTRVKAGTAPGTVNDAFDTVVAQKPDAVIVTGVNVTLWSRQLKQLQEAGIPIVTVGVMGLQEFNIPAPQAAEAVSTLVGKLMADYVTANYSTDAKIAIYTIPELVLTKIISESFTAELAKVCPGCTVRNVPLPISSIGTTAPQTIVSDLQRTPDTTVAVFSTDEIANGLPAALKTAGIKIKTLGQAPSPTTLQYIKDGDHTASLGYDLPVLAWSMIDQAARSITKQPLTGLQADGLSDMQFLSKDDMTFDYSRGWTGYPDFQQRFTTLWGVN